MVPEMMKCEVYFKQCVLALRKRIHHSIASVCMCVTNPMYTDTHLHTRASQLHQDNFLGLFTKLRAPQCQSHRRLSGAPVECLVGTLLPVTFRLLMELSSLHGETVSISLWLWAPLLLEAACTPPQVASTVVRSKGGPDPARLPSLWSPNSLLSQVELLAFKCFCDQLRPSWVIFLFKANPITKHNITTRVTAHHHHGLGN